MDSLVGYGSDDEVESDRYSHQPSVTNAGRRKDDDVNYDDVNMDMSEESGESEPELPPAEPQRTRKMSRDDRMGSNDSRERERDRDRDRDRERDRDRDRDRDRSTERRGRRRDRDRHERDRVSPRRDDRHSRDRAERSRHESSRRSGDRPEAKMPALMDLKPYGDAPHDARDAASPRYRHLTSIVAETWRPKHIDQIIFFTPLNIPNEKIKC